VIVQSREAKEFLEAIGSTAPDEVSACDGWTAHEIAAHVAGIAVEVNRHLDPYLQGEPVPKTRSFEEREAPLQAAAHGNLLTRLVAEEERMRRLVADVLAVNPDSVIPWTGRQMAVAKFIPHLRNEHALHRWDVVGDDEVSDTLLGQAELTEHSVEVLGEILLRAGRNRDPQRDEGLCIRLYSKDERDLYVRVHNGVAALDWEGGASSVPTVTCDAAARLLLIWGRRPDGRGRLRSDLNQVQLARLQVLLSGY
jgi:Mycothiol maleylpyruvate isomerase N-terminal domain